LRYRYWLAVVLLLTVILVGLSVRYPAVILAMAAMQVPLIASLVVHGERLRVFAGREITLAVAIKGNAIALCGGLLVPGRVTELLKPLYFRYRSGLTFNAGVSVVVLERLLDVVAVAAITLVALYAAPAGDTHLIEAGRLIALIALGGCIAMTATLLLWPNHLVWLIHKIPIPRARGWLSATIDRLNDSVQPHTWPTNIGLTLIAWLGSVACYWVFFQLDGGPALGWMESVIVFVVGALGLAITVTPGGLGTFEAAVALTLVHYGYTFDQAMASALGLRIGSFLPVTAVTVHAIVVDGFDLVRARQDMRSAGPG